MGAKEAIKNHYTIILILALSLLLRLYYSSYNIIWWDSAVYIEMGKYIFSLGGVGLWETSRPLVLPAILGFFWKLGADPYVTGRVLDIGFSLGCILLTYLIGKDIFSKRIGLFAAFVLSFTPTFFNNGNYLLTEIISTFFCLLGVYFFVKDKFFLSGVFFGIGFMTRFLQLFGFIALILFSVFGRKEERIKRNFWLLKGFLIPVIPYLALNYILHGDILLPFFHQIYMTANTGFVWHESFSFYFANILKENLLVVFVLLSPLYYLNSKNKNKHIIMLTLMVFAVFYMLVAHKEMRFLITLMPYLFILAGLGFFYVVNRFSKKLMVITAITILTLFFIVSIPKYDAGEQDGRYEAFWSYLDRSDVNDNIWITNPIFALKSDKKVEPIYYDVFSSEKITELEKKIKEPSHILMDSCYDMTCPLNDEACPEMKEKFIEQLRTKFKTVFYERDNICERMILSYI